MLLAPSADAVRSCSRDWVCVEVEQGEQVEVYARNLRSFPLTISLRMRDSDLSRSARATTTVTVGPRERRRLKRFPANGRADYRYYYDWTVGSLEAEHDDTYVYRLPYAHGRSYAVLQGFDSRFSHTGLERYTVDFNMPEGTPVYAAREGVVAMVEESHDIGCWEDWCSRYANYLIVLHDDGTTGEYYHLSRNGVLVNAGERVERGQLVARSGNTGHTTMPHLHFGVYRAASWGRTRSVPFRFESDRGVVDRPQMGARYRAP